jgi:hypothetical protein
MAPEALPYQPPHAVACDRQRHRLARYDRSEPRIVLPVRSTQHGEGLIPGLAGALEDSLKFGRPKQPEALGERFGWTLKGRAQRPGSQALRESRPMESPRGSNWGQTDTALCAPGLEDRPARFRGHARAKSMRAHAFEDARLIRSFHDRPLRIAALAVYAKIFKVTVRSRFVSS